MRREMLVRGHRVVALEQVDVWSRLMGEHAYVHVAWWRGMSLVSRGSKAHETLQREYAHVRVVEAVAGGLPWSRA